MQRHCCVAGPVVVLLYVLQCSVVTVRIPSSAVKSAVVMVKSQGVSLLLVTDGKKKKTNLSLLRIVEKKWFDKSKTLKGILRLRGTNQVKAILWKGRPVGIVVNHGPAEIGCRSRPQARKEPCKTTAAQFHLYSGASCIDPPWMGRRHLPSMSRPGSTVDAIPPM